MQKVSKQYKESMKSIQRNRAYIRVSIGVINSEAQKNVTAENDRNSFAYFSDIKKPFEGEIVEKPYATCEESLSQVDGTMFFLPKENSRFELYNNGIVTKDFLGSVYIDFQGATGLDIKGLTIDFGECYPSEFTIENNGNIRSYSGTRYFVTEDVFSNTSYLIITPVSMVNGNGRMRINKFTCGIVNQFTNAETISYSAKEYVSSITDTIPSNDVSITVDNMNQYYCPDNPDSTLSYMEVGQEVKTEFGYDVTGNGDVEWLPPTTAYMKTWSANDREAKFTATDRFDYLSGTYYRGKYRENGISLYNLALDVFNDAGIEEGEYSIDHYLKNVMVKNPIPVVKHSEALQIIANAGRCVLFEDRQSKIHIQSSFVPDMNVSVNNETEYSRGENLLKKDNKDSYATFSNDLSVVDGSMFFLTKDSNYLNTGYISASISDPNGTFNGENPKITINLEAPYVSYGFAVKFRSVAPKEFHVRTYNQEELVQDLIVTDPDVDYVNVETLDMFDKMEIEITVGHPNARVTIDTVTVGGSIDYTLNRNRELMSSPISKRQSKVKSIAVAKTIYSSSKDALKELKSEEFVINSGGHHTIYLSNPSYGFTASVVDNTSISVQIIEISDFYVTVQLSGSIRQEERVKVSVSGYEYSTSESNFVVSHNDNGEEISWKNPLVSDSQHASDLEEWLSNYYLGDVDYEIDWRGDPRTDANDLFYLELAGRENTVVRTYQNEISFSGSFKGKMKARKAVL